LTITAGFRIDEYRPDYSFHITAYTESVVVELRGHSSYICGGRVACHQMLNEKLGDERGDVWMMEDVVEGQIQLCIPVEPRRDIHIWSPRIIEQRLRSDVVVILV